MRVFLFVFSILVLTFVASCGRTAPVYDEALQESSVEEPSRRENCPAETPAPPPPEETWYVMPEVSLPFDTVASFLAHTQEMFDNDGGALWGFPFHVPILIVDPVTRDVIANRADPSEYLAPAGHVFYGTLPEDVRVWAAGVLTALDFGGEQWVVMSWPFLRSKDHIHRLGLVAHYAMHWHQRCPDFFGGLLAFDNSHMNELEARMSIRLEMNALTRAFRTTGDARTAYVADALAIRAERRRIFDHAEDENIFMNIEGLAQYTEMALPANSPQDIRARVLNGMENMAFQVRDIGLERAFGYFVGAMYAFLLNETDAAWEQNINVRADLGYMLKDAMGISELPPIETINLMRFGYNAISREEHEWADARARMLAWLTEIFINQPTLIIYGNGLDDGISLGFSGHMSSFTEFGTIIIGNTDFSGSFGTLNLRNGYFRRDEADSDSFFIMVTAQSLVIDGNRITAQATDGNRRHSAWTMYLNEGYTFIEYGNGFRVVRCI